MAKLKGSNPADAFRKAQRAKELKRNKENRKAARESQTVKRDTRDLEDEIRAIKSNPKAGASEKARLADLESELNYVIKTKEAYVKAHPEARDRVFKVHAPRSSTATSSAGQEGDDGMSHLYDDQGRLRDPTRSIYYDKVYNPFGVPPPGMPYVEREMPDESDGDEDGDEEEDSDDDIVMPDGPAPGEHSDSDDSDDIPLPPGPPPPRTLPSAMPKAPPSGPAQMLPPIYMTGPPSAVPPGAGSMPFAPPLSGHAGPSRRPPRPSPSVQDPLSDAPTQTYQGYRMDKAGLPSRPETGSDNATLPPRPEVPLRKPMPEGAGTISAEPQLRDLRKEATAFVPRGVKKKTTGSASGAGKTSGLGPGRINAAPGAGVVDEDGDQVKYASPQNGGGGLMGVLKGVLDKPAAPSAAGRKPEEVEDDYQKFLEGLNDLA